MSQGKGTISSNDLMQKLVVAKKIMDAHSGINRGTVASNPVLENFDTPNASYNIPQEYMGEVAQERPNFDPTQPLEESRIKNSKLPDEIKRLMIEHPISQPQQQGGGGGDGVKKNNSGSLTISTATIPK